MRRSIQILNEIDEIDDWGSAYGVCIRKFKDFWIHT